MSERCSTALQIGERVLVRDHAWRVRRVLPLGPGRSLVDLVPADGRDLRPLSVVVPPERVVPLPTEDLRFDPSRVAPIGPWWRSHEALSLTAISVLELMARRRAGRVLIVVLPGLLLSSLKDADLTGRRTRSTATCRGSSGTGKSWTSGSPWRCRARTSSAGPRRRTSSSADSTSRAGSGGPKRVYLATLAQLVTGPQRGSQARRRVPRPSRRLRRGARQRGGCRGA